VRTGGFTPLRYNLPGMHYVWSADGQHIGYAIGTGQIGVADADGGNPRLVPVIGDTNPATNPSQKRSFDYLLPPEKLRLTRRSSGGLVGLAERIGLWAPGFSRSERRGGRS
jgi:hypothetical protein